MKISNYSEIYQIGNRATRTLFSSAVVVQEKIDGSQFSFANIEGKLHCRSKNNAVGAGGNAEGMFGKAYSTAKAIFETDTLPEGMVVRGEVLDKPLHNVLKYDRVPIGNIIVYDIEMPQRSGNYLRPGEMETKVESWGLEVVPLIAYQELTLDDFRGKLPEWLERISILGGAKIEGVVVKNYRERDQHDNILMGKFVSEKFKEKMDPDHIAKPIGNAVQQILAGYQKEAIWQKAIQHLRDAGELKDEPKDIGRLVAEIKRDFRKENGEDVIEKLLKAYYGEVEAGILMGFPQWYKAKILEGNE